MKYLAKFLTQNTNSLFGLLVLSIWLTLKPYYGIWHDESLYVLMALDAIHPERYAHDLFFLYSSQSSFTSFTRLLSVCINTFGLDTGVELATALGQAFWISALIWLTTALIPRKLWLWALFAVAIFPPYYTQVFSYGEPFTTARLYSEALTLFGLGALLRARNILAWTSLLLGTAMHPLMGLPGIGIAMLMKIRRIQTWAAIAFCTMMLTIVAAMLHLGPFATMNHVLPPNLVAFEQRASWTFLHLWRWDNISIVSYALIILTLAITELNANAYRMARYALIVALVGLIIAGIADYTDYSFLLALQTTRFLWLAQLFSVLLWFPLAEHLWNEGDRGRITIIILASAALSAPLAKICLAFPALAYWWSRKLPMFNIQPSRLIWALVWLFPIQTAVWLALDDKLLYTKHLYLLQDPAWYAAYSSFLQPLVMAAAILWFFVPTTRLVLRPLLLLAPVTLLVAVLHWDQRKSESLPTTPVRQRVIASLQRLVPENAVVYWEHGVHYSWYWLQRSNYISQNQLAGSIFDSRISVEAIRRMTRLQHAGFPDSVWDIRGEPKNMLLIQPHPLADAAYVCADPVLHTLILRYPIPGLASEYPFSDPNTGYHYYAYACRAVLNAEHAKPSITTPQGEPHA